MNKTCKHCQTSFEITQDDLVFYDKISPSFPVDSFASQSSTEIASSVVPPSSQGHNKQMKKYLIPSPTLCPDCRQQRRLSFRNESKLYKRKCDLTGNEIISIYSPDKVVKAYNAKDWISDKWNPLDYSKNFDFSRVFFEQFKEFSFIIPKIALHTDITMENCDYCNYGQHSKDCYLTFSSVWSQNCLYSQGPVKGLEDNDGMINIGNQYCYECIHCNNCYEVQYGRYSQECKNSYFLLDCTSCEYCFGCINLQHKKYCFLNEQLSEDEYKTLINKISGNQSELIEFKSKYEYFILEYPRKNLRNTNIENCTGDFIQHSKNCVNCFSVFGTEKCKDTNFAGIKSTYMYSCFYTGDSTNIIYECIGQSRTYKSAFCIYGRGLINCFYCINSENCSDCFGCVGLKNKSYCILNKQYTKEEYELLVPSIIEHMQSTGEWGEFFPSSLSPFGYNETVAMEYFPMTREEVLNPSSLREANKVSDEAIHAQDKPKTSEWIASSVVPPSSQGQTFLQGPIFNWSTYEAPFPKVDKIISRENMNKLPDNIKDIPDDILNWALTCEISGKPFRIIKQELEFYRKHNIPVPRRHPDQRHLDRMKLRNPRKLFDRKCDKCGIEMKTTYAPDRPEIVYCEGCYNKKVY